MIGKIIITGIILLVLVGVVVVNAQVGINNERARQLTNFIVEKLFEKSYAEGFTDHRLPSQMERDTSIVRERQYRNSDIVILETTLDNKPVKVVTTNSQLDR